MLGAFGSAVLTNVRHNHTRACDREAVYRTIDGCSREIVRPYVRHQQLRDKICQVTTYKLQINFFPLAIAYCWCRTIIELIIVPATPDKLGLQHTRQERSPINIQSQNSAVSIPSPILLARVWKRERRTGDLQLHQATFSCEGQNTTAAEAVTAEAALWCTQKQPLSPTFPLPVFLLLHLPACGCTGRALGLSRTECPTSWPHGIKSSTKIC